MKLALIIYMLINNEILMKITFHRLMKMPCNGHEFSYIDLLKWLVGFNWVLIVVCDASLITGWLLYFTSHWFEKSFKYFCSHKVINYSVVMSLLHYCVVYVSNIIVISLHWRWLTIKWVVVPLACLVSKHISLILVTLYIAYC